MIDEDYDIASEAVKRWIKSSKWPPRSAELLDLMEDIAAERGAKALPPHINTPEDYERLLRIEKLAQDMGITLHPSHTQPLKDAHAWKATQ